MVGHVRPMLRRVAVSLFSVEYDTMSLPSAGSERSIGVRGTGDGVYRGCARMIDCSHSHAGRAS
jgi:hypothetical protein